MAIVLGATLCLISGYLVVASLWPQMAASKLEWPLKLPLAAAFGLGIFSITFLLERLAAVTHIWLADSFVMALLFALYRLRHARPRETCEIFTIPDLTFPGWLGHILKASFALSILSAAYAAISGALAHLQGDGWDAFAIWNLRARFLFLSGTNWRDAFSPLIPWSHPDYPLLVPAAVAHLWTYLRHNSTAVPAIVGLLFASGTIALLFSSLKNLRGPNSAMLAGIALAATPFFVEQASSQYVDIPLSFFFLAAIALVHLNQQLSPEPRTMSSFGFLSLAGLSAGFAAWTKNEGLLFLLAFFAAQVESAVTNREMKHAWPGRWARLAALTLSTVPTLVFIAWFKHSLAPRGDLFADSADMVHKLGTPGRYWIVLQWYGKEFLRFGNWWIVPGTALLLVFYALIRKPGARQGNPALRSSIITLALTALGYFVVYVITPRDVYWHLRFSLNRLFLQLWPATVFLFFLSVGRQKPANISK